MLVDERVEPVEGEAPMCPAGKEVYPREAPAGAVKPAAQPEPEPEPEPKVEPTKDDAIEMELE
jgi:hypothetical protein